MLSLLKNLKQGIDDWIDSHAEKAADDGRIHRYDLRIEPNAAIPFRMTRNFLYSLFPSATLEEAEARRQKLVDRFGVRSGLRGEQVSIVHYSLSPGEGLDF